MKTFLFLLFCLSLVGCARFKVTSATTPEWEKIKGQKGQTFFKVDGVSTKQVRSIISTSTFENPGTGFTPVYTTDKYLCQVEGKATVTLKGGDTPLWVGTVSAEGACHDSLPCRSLTALADRALADGVVAVAVTSEALCPSEIIPPVAAATPSQK